MHFHDLETERLLLKGISPEDREFIFRQFSTEAVNRYLFDAEPLRDVDGADEIIRFYLQPEPRAHHRWIVTRKDDGATVGTCGFHAWNRERARCEIGYDLAPEYWGNGYMSEALRAVIVFARDKMQVREIQACIYPDNLGSINLAQRLGFVFQGETRELEFRGGIYSHRILVLDPGTQTST